MRVPAEVFPPGEFIRDELNARGITKHGFLALLAAAGCSAAQILACELAAYVDDKNLILDRSTAECLGKVFDVDADYFINLDRMWRGVK